MIPSQQILKLAKDNAETDIENLEWASGGFHDAI